MTADRINLFNQHHNAAVKIIGLFDAAHQPAGTRVGISGNGLIKMALRNFRYEALSSEHAGIYFGAGCGICRGLVKCRPEHCSL